MRADPAPRAETALTVVPDPVPEGSVLRSWSNLPVPAVQKRGADLERLVRGSVLSRGLGRSYNDASFPPADHPVATCTTLADRVLSFDAQTGILRAEAGVCLRDLIWMMLPRGFYPPVTPGTWYVTLGGMVASDVHGKNHHEAGCFGEHVVGLKLMLASGEVVECSAERHPDLFLATIGGMGLTGHILEVTFRMSRVPSPWIWQVTIPVRDLDHLLDALEASGENWPMTVSWTDCFAGGAGAGRGLLIVGRWATPEEADRPPPSPFGRITVPAWTPGWFVNPLFGRMGYMALVAKSRRTMSVVHPETFFTPLDKVLEWNRAYGASGLTQYQCVLPRAAGHDAPREVLALLRELGAAVYLAVVKDCGPQGRGMLSFPMPGVTLALDLKVDANTPAVVAAVNERVIAWGGRVYLAKDAYTTAEHFRRMEPRLDAFLEVRERWDPEHRIRSVLSQRLFGDP